MSTYASSNWRDADSPLNNLRAVAAAAAEAVQGATQGPTREHGRRSHRGHDGRQHRGHEGQRRDRAHERADTNDRFDRSEGGAGGPGFGHGHGGSGHGGSGHGGPGFGPPGPWRARGRGRGRGAKRGGDVRAAILVLLDEQPRHGYELIGEISERSGGVWRPSPGTVYPTLSQLEDEGLIRLERLDGRKTATLTDQGRAYVEANRGQLGQPWADVAGGVRAENLALRGIIAQVGVAASTVALHGTPDQATRAAEVLEQARQELYGLMAEPKTEPTPGPSDAPDTPTE